MNPKEFLQYIRHTYRILTIMCLCVCVCQVVHGFFSLEKNRTYGNVGKVI